MRFAVERAGNGFEIIALLDEHDVLESNRMEGPRVPIKLKTHRAYFGGITADEVHPDHLALAAVLTFFPFIGRSVTFAWFVSPAVARALQLLGKATASNLDGKPFVNENTRPALLYGGGADSCAAHCLYPDALLIHGFDLKPDSKERFPSRLERLFEGVDGFSCVALDTNARNLVTPWGWVGWFTVLAYGLIFAQKYRIGYVMTGSVLSASFLGTGVKFHDIMALPPEHGPTCNVWQEACAVVGVPTFAPLASVCEPTTSALAFSKYSRRHIVSCSSGPTGDECGRCYKCLRKLLLYQTMTNNFGGDYSAFIHHADKLPDRPGLPFSPCYANMFTIWETRGVVDKFPEWITKPLSKLPRIRWDGCYYPDGVEIVPAKFRKRLLDSLNSFLVPMNAATVAQVRNWHTLPGL